METKIDSQEEIPKKYTSSYMSWISIFNNLCKNFGIELTPSLLASIEALINKLDKFSGDSKELDKFGQEFTAFINNENMTTLLSKIESQSRNIYNENITNLSSKIESPSNKTPKKIDNEKYRVLIKYSDGTEVKIQ